MCEYLLNLRTRELCDLARVQSPAASVTSGYTPSFSSGRNQVKKEILATYTFFLRGHSWLVCLPPCLSCLCIAFSVRQISFELELPLLIVLSEFGILTLHYWSWHR